MARAESRGRIVIKSTSCSHQIKSRYLSRIWLGAFCGLAVCGFVAAGLFSGMTCGSYHSLALKQDGTVVAWGQTSVPAGLSNVVAVAAAADNSLALKSDGTVVGWGRLR